MRPELFLKPNKFISLLLRKPANTGLRNFASETGHTSGLRNNRVCEFRKLEPQCISNSSLKVGGKNYVHFYPTFLIWRSQKNGQKLVLTTNEKSNRKGLKRVFGDYLDTIV